MSSRLRRFKTLPGQMPLISPQVALIGLSFDSRAFVQNNAVPIASPEEPRRIAKGLFGAELADVSPKIFSTEDLKQLVQASEAIQKQTGLDAFSATLLANRGHQAGSELVNYLNPDINRWLRNFHLLKNCSLGANILAQAISKKELITGCHDIDVDGQTSGAQLKLTCDALGVPVRLRQWCREQPLESHGLNSAMVEWVKQKPAGVVVVCDMGSKDAKAVEHLSSLGYKVIIADHHGADTFASPAALINPTQPGCNFANGRLAAGPIVRLLIEATFSALNQKIPTKLESQLNLLAGFAQIADQADLIEAGRDFAAACLKNLGPSSQIKGLAMLCKGQSLKGDSTSDVFFYLAPLINALYRILPREDERETQGKLQHGLTILTSEDTEEIALSIEKAKEANKVRQAIEKDLFLEGTSIQHGDPQNGFISHIEGAHPGVIGVAIARQKEIRGMSAIAISRENQLGAASLSGRFVEGQNGRKTVEHAVKVGAIAQGGGHEFASGGKTHAHPNMQRLIEDLQQAISLSGKRVLEQKKPDIRCNEKTLKELASQLLKTKTILEPCGKKNLPPLVMIDDFSQQTLSGKDIHLSGQGKSGVRVRHFHVAQELIPGKRGHGGLIVADESPRVLIGELNSDWWEKRRIAWIRAIHLLEGAPETQTKKEPMRLEMGERTRLPKSNEDLFFVQKNAVPSLFHSITEVPIPPSLEEFLSKHRLTSLIDPAKIHYMPAQLGMLEVFSLRLAQETQQRSVFQLEATTGFGKTITAIFLAAKFLEADPKARILHLTKDSQLVEQAADDYKLHVKLPESSYLMLSGNVPRKQREDLHQSIVIGDSDEFIANERKTDDFDLVILDEGDSAKGQDSHQKVLNQIMQSSKKQTILLMSGTLSDKDAEAKERTSDLLAHPIDRVDFRDNYRVVDPHEIKLDADALAVEQKIVQVYNKRKELLIADIKARSQLPVELQRILQLFKKYRIIPIHKLSKDIKLKSGKVIPSPMAEIRKLYEAAKGNQNRDDRQFYGSLLGQLAELRFLERVNENLLTSGKFFFLQRLACATWQELWPSSDVYSRTSEDSKSGHSFSRASVLRDLKQVLLEYSVDLPFGPVFQCYFDKNAPSDSGQALAKRALGLEIDSNLAAPQVAAQFFKQSTKVCARTDAISDAKDRAIVEIVNTYRTGLVIVSEMAIDAAFLKFRLQHLLGESRTVEFVAGRKFQSPKKKAKILKRLEADPALLIVSTATLDFGVDNASIRAILSKGTPKNSVILKQRTGRTARWSKQYYGMHMALIASGLQGARLTPDQVRLDAIKNHRFAMNRRNKKRPYWVVEERPSA